MSVTIILPGVIVRELRRRVEASGMSLEEFIAEIATEDIDPSERAGRYVKAALELLDQVRVELDRGNLRQASEKIWGACALAVKAYAYARDGRRITFHGELWRYSEVLAGDLGDWVAASWAHANSMHTNFYEGWATRWHVEKALRAVEKLVKAIVEKVG